MSFPLFVSIANAIREVERSKNERSIPFFVSRLVVERKQQGVKKLMLDGVILLSEVLNLCFELTS
jgi:hypothetical protein